MQDVDPVLLARVAVDRRVRAFLAYFSTGADTTTAATVRNAPRGLHGKAVHWTSATAGAASDLEDFAGSG